MSLFPLLGLIIWAKTTCSCVSNFQFALSVVGTVVPVASALSVPGGMDIWCLLRRWMLGTEKCNMSYYWFCNIVFFCCFFSNNIKIYMCGLAWSMTLLGWLFHTHVFTSLKLCSSKSTKLSIFKVNSLFFSFTRCSWGKVLGVWLIMWFFLGLEDSLAHPVP